MIKMNLPNKLTMLRVFLIPIFILLFIFDFDTTFSFSFINYNITLNRFLSALIFVCASITDYFDGMIARKYNLITNFGKLMDPLADKMLVITALILFTNVGEVNYLITLIVVLREIIISSIRLVAVEQNLVIAASKLGKIKTATQMIAIVLLLFNVHKVNTMCYYIVYFILYFSTFFVVVSLIDYIVKNKNVFNN